MYAIFIFFWLTSLAAYADYDVRASVKIEYDLIHCMHVFFKSGKEGLKLL